MNKNTSLVLIFLLWLIIGIGGYMLYTEMTKENSEQIANPVEDDTIWEDIIDQDDEDTQTGVSISVSEDGKIIMRNDVPLLAIDDMRLMNMFREESQLCDEFNITSSDERRAFCEEREAFVSQTSFTSIAVSPDMNEIWFKLESEAMIPDALVGFLSVSSGEIIFLSNFYLWNELIGFSPSGTYFAYRGMCWEAKCGVSIRDSETLEEVWSINNPEYIDMRQDDMQFIRWISDSEVEYEIGGEVLQLSF